jgi:hypothetical protein
MGFWEFILSEARIGRDLEAVTRSVLAFQKPYGGVRGMVGKSVDVEVSGWGDALGPSGLWD